MTNAQRFTAGFLLVVMFGLLCAVGRSAPQDGEQITAAEKQFWGLLNEYRKSRGLNEVSYDTDLAADAHVNNRGRAPHNFMGRAHSQNWCMASGGETPARAMQQWKTSPPHNKAMLGAGFTRIGVAFDGNEATLNLAR